MEFTGERFIPGKVSSCIHYEHVHRYLFAKPLAEGRRVLDLGSGEGYGTAILAEAASEALGVEASREAVEHAARQYAGSRARFLCADARKLPLADGSYDLVVCFELIEHVAECEAVLAEISRVLSPEGRLVISSPNKRFYHRHDQGAGENPFHARELEREEFEALLAAHFPERRILSQSLALGSLIWPQTVEGRWETLVTEGLREHPEKEVPRPRPDPVYTVAVCSKRSGSMPDVGAGPSLLLDSAASAVRSQESHVADMMKHMKAKDEHIADMARHMKAKDEHIADMMRHMKIKDETIASLDRLIRNPLAYARHQAARGGRWLSRLASRSR